MSITQQLCDTNFTKTLIKDGLLNTPTTLDFEKAEFVLSQIKDFKTVYKFPCISNYNRELKKAYYELNKNFENYFDSTSLESKNISANINEKIYSILKKIQINPTSYYQEFQSIFKIENNQILPLSLEVPDELDNLSYIYIGHEFIHLLKDTNIKEFKMSLILGEVLPMLYELLQMKYKNKNTKKYIINTRINCLLEMNQSLEKEKKKSLLNEDDFNVYKLLDYTYFISFYYAILLYNIYLKYPSTLLKEFKNILLHKKTTQELLNFFEIPESINTIDFNKSYKKILKIVS